MDDRQRQTDRKSRESDWRIFLRHAQDHNQEQECRNDFKNKGRAQIVFAEISLSEPVRSKTVRTDFISGLAGCDQIQNTGTDHSSDELRDPILDHLA